MEDDVDRSTPAASPELGHSRVALDRDERLVKDGILRMGSLVETQIRSAIRALVEHDTGLASAVIGADARINAAQRDVNEAVAMTIATQSPVARDLRFLLALSHTGYELERIGDHASSVAKQVQFLSDDRSLPAAAEIGRMGELAADLVRGVVAALIDVDDTAARAVAARDDEIDHGYRKVFADVIEAMQADPAAIEPGTRLVLAAHWIERIGDRVTNVAEDIVYLATGQIEDLNP